MVKSKIFLLAISMILKHEGSTYTCHPNDPGKGTKYGISSARFPHVDIKNLTKNQAVDLYWEHYWNAFDLDGIPGERTSAKLLDIFVNFNPKTAAKIAQRAVNYFSEQCDWVTVDGVMGTNTKLGIVRCLRRVGDEAFACAISGFQMAYYQRRVHNTPSSRVFAAGWVKRAINPEFCSEVDKDITV